MKNNREFGEGPLYTIMNYIMWLFTGNFYFLLCNILLIFVVFAFQGSFTVEYSILLIISLLPVGPTLTALFSAMGRLVREKDVAVTKSYFKGIKDSFAQSLFLWTLEILAITILFVDIKFFSAHSYGRMMTPIFYAFIILVFITGLYVFPLVSRFSLKNIDVIKLSFILAITKIKVTLLNVGSILLAGLLVYKFTPVVILFVVCSVCYLIMFFEKDIIKELEEKITGSQTDGVGNPKQ